MSLNGTHAVVRTARLLAAPTLATPRAVGERSNLRHATRAQRAGNMRAMFEGSGMTTTPMASRAPASARGRSRPLIDVEEHR
jgi:hypothetical protein